MWPFKPKLKLNFYDPEYDTLMDLFKQVNYLNKIADAILDEWSYPPHIVSLMRAFTMIHSQIQAKILQNHKRKELDFHRFEQDKFEKDLIDSGVDPSSIPTINQETLELLHEIHCVRRESRYNKLVSDTYVKILNGIARFAQRIDGCDDRIDTLYSGIYRFPLIDFLKNLNKSIDFYKLIGKWLKEDRKSIEKYKKILGAKVQKQSKHAVIQMN